MNARERRRIGITDEEWRYEQVVERIDDLPGVFAPSDAYKSETDMRLILRVLDDLVGAGLLRELDLKDGLRYVRTDVPCALRVPQMQLYRCFDAHGGLLYIGISSASAEERIGSHARTKAWWPQVARWTVETVSGYQAGITAERAAIEAERPLHNKAHNRARREVPA